MGMGPSPPCSGLSQSRSRSSLMKKGSTSSQPSRRRRGRPIRHSRAAGRDGGPNIDAEPPPMTRPCSAGARAPRPSARRAVKAERPGQDEAVAVEQAHGVAVGDGVGHGARGGLPRLRSAGRCGAGSAESRFAMTQPAEPPPTITVSKKGMSGMGRGRASDHTGLSIDVLDLRVVDQRSPAVQPAGGRPAIAAGLASANSLLWPLIHTVLLRSARATRMARAPSRVHTLAESRSLCGWRVTASFSSAKRSMTTSGPAPPARRRRRCRRGPAAWGRGRRSSPARRRGGRRRAPPHRRWPRLLRSSAPPAGEVIDERTHSAFAAPGAIFRLGEGAPSAPPSLPSAALVDKDAPGSCTLLAGDDGGRRRELRRHGLHVRILEHEAAGLAAQPPAIASSAVAPASAMMRAGGVGAGKR